VSAPERAGDAPYRPIRVALDSGCSTRTWLQSGCSFTVAEAWSQLADGVGAVPAGRGLGHSRIEGA
jgi:hypothetical protein